MTNVRRKRRFRDSDMVPVAVAFDETDLREQLRKMRARWDSQVKLWSLAYRRIRGTPLEARIAASY